MSQFTKILKIHRLIINLHICTLCGLKTSCTYLWFSEVKTFSLLKFILFGSHMVNCSSGIIYLKGNTMHPLQLSTKEQNKTNGLN